MPRPAPIRAPRHRAGFCILFAAYISLLVLSFDRWESIFASLYLYPVSLVTATLLDLIGVHATLDTSSLALGFCILVMEQITFHVKYECTGIFALFIYLAAIFAYPAAAAYKVRGVLIGISAFFAYSALRLVLLGLIGHLIPAWIRFCHIYLMVLFNMGFVLFLWASWVNREPSGRKDDRR